MREVSKTYETRSTGATLALRESSLDLRPGEFFSLVGPSGCGKSTMLNMVAGLLPPTTGTIVVGDREVTRPDPSTGIVFQRATLLRWLTVMENVLLPCTVHGWVTDEVRATAQRLLAVAGLENHASHYPRELSGGMQQRAAIVRALVADPTVLLMDEPFSALDEFTRETLNDELLRLWTERPKTVLFITHNIAEAVYLSDRVGVMNARPGRLVGIVDVDLERPRTSELRTDGRFFDLVREVRTMIGADTTSEALVGEGAGR